jgi:uncharacterized membrane protein
VSTSTILIVAGAFLASAVELVEALTIVLGVGYVRGWRSTLFGVAAAVVVLGVIVAAGRGSPVPLLAERFVLVVKRLVSARAEDGLAQSPTTKFHWKRPNATT